MKKILGLLIVAAVLGLYAYYGIYVPDKDSFKKTSKSNPIQFENLSEIYIFQSDKSLRLKLIGDFWWVVEPEKYPSDQKFIEKLLKIMTQAPVIDQFVLKEDRYGFKPGQAFIEFTYKDGLRQRLIVGSEDAPHSGLYVLDKDSRMAYVFHNVWGQAFYHSVSRFYTTFLPIAGRKVKEISFVGRKQKWKVETTPQGEIKATRDGQSQIFPRAPWLWFFKQFGEFTLEKHQFNQQSSIASPALLQVITEKGNIRFEIDEDNGNIYIPSLKVFAQFDSGSLRSLHKEFNKVFESDKK